MSKMAPHPHRFIHLHVCCHLIWFQFLFSSICSFTLFLQSNATSLWLEWPCWLVDKRVRGREQEKEQLSSQLCRALACFPNLFRKACWWLMKLSEENVHKHILTKGFLCYINCIAQQKNWDMTQMFYTVVFILESLATLDLQSLEFIRT